MLSAGQWAAVETGVAASTARMLGMLPAGPAAALSAQVTLDLEVYEVAVRESDHGPPIEPHPDP